MEGTKEMGNVDGVEELRRRHGRQTWEGRLNVSSMRALIGSEQLNV